MKVEIEITKHDVNGNDDRVAGLILDNVVSYYPKTGKMILKNVISIKPMEVTMGFSEAVKALKMGNRVRRIGWVEKFLTLNGIGALCSNEGYYTEITIEDLEAIDWWVVT